MSWKIEKHASPPARRTSDTAQARPVGAMRRGCWQYGVALGLLVCFAPCLTLADADEEWIEAFDKASGKKFFYQQAGGASAWEAPAGAKIRYMSDEGGDARGGGGGDDDSASKGGGRASVVLLGLLVPIVLPLLGLLVCYWRASKEGLADALRAMAKTRDRSRKRRGTKSGGNFRQRHKLSQDGKGGRSANS